MRSVVIEKPRCTESLPRSHGEAIVPDLPAESLGSPTTSWFLVHPSSTCSTLRPNPTPTNSMKIVIRWASPKAPFPSELRNDYRGPVALAEHRISECKGVVFRSSVLWVKRTIKRTSSHVQKEVLVVVAFLSCLFFSALLGGRDGVLSTCI